MKQRKELFPYDFFGSNESGDIFNGCYNQFNCPLTITRNIKTNHSNRNKYMCLDKVNIASCNSGVIDLQKEYDEDKEILEMLDYGNLKDKKMYYGNKYKGKECLGWIDSFGNKELSCNSVKNASSKQPNELFKRNLVIYHKPSSPLSNVMLPKLILKPQMHPALHLRIHRPDMQRHYQRNIKNSFLIGNTNISSLNYNDNNIQ